MLCTQYFESDDPDLYTAKVQYIRENDVRDLELVFAEEEFTEDGTAQVGATGSPWWGTGGLATVGYWGAGMVLGYWGTGSSGVLGGWDGTGGLGDWLQWGTGGAGTVLAPVGYWGTGGLSPVGYWLGPSSWVLLWLPPTQVVPLIDHGEDVKVTEKNKLQYLNLLAQYRLARQTKTEMEHFLKGYSCDLCMKFTISTNCTCINR